MKIIDLHCDTLYQIGKAEGYSFFQNEGHISEEGLVKGDYLAQSFAIYQPADMTGEEGFDYFKKQCELFEKTVAESEVLKKAVSAEQILKNEQNGKISALLTVENAGFLMDDLSRLDFAEEKGVKILGLIHNGENCIGFPQDVDNDKDLLGLKPFGKEVIDRLNSDRMIVDVSHLNYGGFMDVADIAKKPFIATHSACRDVFDHPRNLYDNQIRLVAEKGGVVGMIFYSDVLDGTNETKAEAMLYHLEHLIEVGGEDVAALGSDFDGIESKLFIKGAEEMQVLADMLIKKFGCNLAEKICYKNALRLF